MEIEEAKNNELNKLKKEKDSFQNEIAKAQGSFAKDMMNGMGVDMMNTLKSPEVPDHENKNPFSRFFKKLIKTLTPNEEDTFI
jgi:hypothetical protein